MGLHLYCTSSFPLSQLKRRPHAPVSYFHCDDLRDIIVNIDLIKDIVLRVVHL